MTGKSIFLLADSELLFWKEGQQPFINRVVTRDLMKAAYIGASNGDEPAFYSIFEVAMERIGIRDCRMIRSVLSEEDIAFLNQAEIILLAGGEVGRGWRTFLANGLNDLIPRRYYEGAALIGISAGAVQLGVSGWDETESEEIIETFKLVPRIVGAHEEAGDWKTTKALLARSKADMRAIGLPKGGGAIFHPDHTIEPVRYPLHEFSLEGGEIRHRLLNPPAETTVLL